MDISAGLILLLTFTLPAIACNYTFQYFSRIRRPLEDSAVSSISALLFSAVFVHSVAIGIVLKFDSGNLGELISHTVEQIFSEFNISDPNSELHYQYAGNDFISDVIQYTASTIALGGFIGIIVARWSAYGWWPCDLVGRMYYGGLYGAYRGFISHEVWAAILSKEKIDGKNVIYSGILEELKLKSSGQIDYASISKPYKSIISYDKTELNIKSSQPHLMGNSLSSLYGNEVSPPEDISMNQFSSYRLMIEGEDIANIHFERHDARDTFEYWLNTKVLFDEHGKFRTSIPVLILLISLLIVAYFLAS